MPQGHNQNQGSWGRMKEWWPCLHFETLLIALSIYVLSSPLSHQFSLQTIFFFKNLLSLASSFCFLPESCLETPILPQWLHPVKGCLKKMIHDLSFYISSSFTCIQNWIWCQLSISASSWGSKKISRSLFLGGLWEGRICSVCRAARHLRNSSSVQQSWWESPADQLLVIRST